MARPDWLRGEAAYRAYIRGVRFALIFAAAFALTAILGVNKIIDASATKALALTCIAAAGASILTGAIGWLLVPDKNRAANQGGMITIIIHDIFLGIPAPPSQV